MYKRRRLLTRATCLALAICAVISVTACGKGESVSFTSLELAKTQAIENATFNAQRYRTTNPKYSGWDIIAAGDSTQTPQCPQGDGWATPSLINPEKTTVVKLKCSTVSMATGCLEDKEFKTKSYANDDGVCQDVNKVPYPIPKIAK